MTRRLSLTKETLQVLQSADVDAGGYLRPIYLTPTILCSVAAPCYTHVATCFCQATVHGAVCATDKDASF